MTKRMRTYTKFVPTKANVFTFYDVRSRKVQQTSRKCVTKALLI